jgi:hypothetical protein
MQDDFATFLLERAAASHGEIVAAIDQQQRSRLTIGRLALQLGVLESTDVFSILAHQARQGSMRFGEAAIALRLLGQAAVDELLLEQRKRTPPLEGFLVKAGVIDEAKARSLREEFERLHPSASHIRAAVPRASGRTG